MRFGRVRWRAVASRAVTSYRTLTEGSQDQQAVELVGNDLVLDHRPEHGHGQGGVPGLAERKTVVGVAEIGDASFGIDGAIRVMSTTRQKHTATQARANDLVHMARSTYVLWLVVAEARWSELAC